MIINIEGTDGCGKQTQTKLLYDYLTQKGYKCLSLSFPNYENQGCGPVKMYLNKEFGDDINCLDPQQVNSLFAVDRLTTVVQYAQKDEQNNTIYFADYDFVLLDRYVAASMIHQSSVLDDNEEIDKYVEWVNFFEFDVLKIPKPDKVLFLDVPVKISIELAKERLSYKSGLNHDIFEEDELRMERAYVHASYLANKFGWERIECADKKLKSIDEIHNLILTKLGV